MRLRQVSIRWPRSRWLNSCELAPGSLHPDGARVRAASEGGPRCRITPPPCTAQNSAGLLRPPKAAPDGRGYGVVRRALTAKPIASNGASSSTRRLSLISTSVGTRGPAWLSRLLCCALIWLSRWP